MLNRIHNYDSTPYTRQSPQHSSTHDRFKAQFQQQGYLQYKSLELDIVSKLVLIDEFRHLEKAPHFGGAEQRYIRSSAALILPWEPELQPVWLPDEAPLDHRVNFKETTSQQYAALSAQVKQTIYLNQLIVDDFQLTFGLQQNQLPVRVGVHFMKLSTENPQRLAINSPDYFYQDQELFTFAHLVYRSNNLAGGVHYIATAQEKQKRLDEVDRQKILQQFTLQHPADSFAIYDPTVVHYVTPIQQMEQSLNKDAGEYWMIVIDFSPTQTKA